MAEDPLPQGDEVKVLYPADPSNPNTITEGIWVLPIVGDENEGTGIILNNSVSGEERFCLGDLATWVSASPATQRAEIVASKHLAWRTHREFLAHDGVALARAYHSENEARRKEHVKTTEIYRCELCGAPGIGRLLPNDVWRAVIPAEHQSKVLCDSCIDRFERVFREREVRSSSRWLFWRR